MRYFSEFAAATAIFLIHAGMVHAQTPPTRQVQVPLVPGTQIPSKPHTPLHLRGKYLVQVAGCTDCHTPGYLLGKEDTTRFLGGSDVGFAVPDLGVFVGPNLTPDNDTGLGSWTRQQIVTAIRTGVRPDGRVLAPVMPWQRFATLTDSDAYAIADYLKSLPPVAHKVPGPFGPSEKLPVLPMTVLPPTAEGAKP